MSAVSTLSGASASSARSQSASAGSISMATTWRAARTRRWVSTPRPGPTSRTASRVGSRRAASTIAAAIDWSSRNDWDRPFRGHSPSARRRPLEFGRKGRQFARVMAELRSTDGLEGRLQALSRHVSAAPPVDVEEGGWPCTRCRSGRRHSREPANSGPAPLRHPTSTPYCCFLPDLTGFEGRRRAGPGLQRCAARCRAVDTRPRTGLQPR